jgi:hypothetical protein
MTLNSDADEDGDDKGVDRADGDNGLVDNHEKEFGLGIAEGENGDITTKGHGEHTRRPRVERLVTAAEIL